MISRAVAISVVLISARAGAFHFENHEYYTKKALKFLKAQVLNEITAKKHKEEIIVTKGIIMKLLVARPQDLHFDECDYEGATTRIRKRYREAVKEIVKSKKQLAGAEEFGALLHTVQDFYAHSNWIESGQTGLIDSRLSSWKVLRPWDQIGDTVLVGGKVPKGRQFIRKGRVLTVYRNMATTLETKLKGIITGTYPHSSKENCVKEAKVGHWEDFPAELIDSKLDKGGLNKDDGNRPGFYKAIHLATTQTRHEWCRLVHMVFEKGGADAANRLIDNWVANKSEAEAACPAPSTMGKMPSIQFDPLKSFRPGE